MDSQARGASATANATERQPLGSRKVPWITEMVGVRVSTPAKRPSATAEGVLRCITSGRSSLIILISALNARKWLLGDDLLKAGNVRVSSKPSANSSPRSAAAIVRNPLTDALAAIGRTKCFNVSPIEATNRTVGALLAPTWRDLLDVTWS